MTPSASTYTVTAVTVGGGVAEADPGGVQLRFDASAGAATGLPGPADLLVTAFAACVLKNLERAASRSGFRYEGAELRVTAERQDAPPRMSRIEYRLELVTDETPRRVDLMHRNIVKFGTIYNTLAAACDVDGTVAVRSAR